MDRLDAWLDGLGRLTAGSAGHVARVEVDRAQVRPTRSGALLVLRGDLVVKLHHPRTDAPVLSERLRLAGSPHLGSVLLAPLVARPQPVPADLSTQLEGGWCWASVWPRVEVLDPGSAADEVPWADAGALLAGLHVAGSKPAGRSRPAGMSAGPPPAGDLARLDRALARLERAAEPDRDGVVHAEADRRAVLRAGRAVRAELTAAPGSAPPSWTLVHGDWHLGQLGRRPAVDAAEPERPWELIDVDDLGIGCPATDLARPAGFWAVGLLDDASWSAFVEGYRAAGGPAVPATGEVWPHLDLHARAAVVVAAARSLLDAAGSGAPLDDDGTAFVQACHRMLGGSSARVGTRGAAGRRPG